MRQKNISHLIDLSLGQGDADQGREVDHVRLQALQGRVQVKKIVRKLILSRVGLQGS